MEMRTLGTQGLVVSARVVEREANLDASVISTDARASGTPSLLAEGSEAASQLEMSLVVDVLLVPVVENPP